MPYQEYVRARVLQPVGATRTRQGRTRLADALAEDEMSRQGVGLLALYAAASRHRERRRA